LYYQKSLSLNDNDFTTYFNCGNAYIELNLKKEALKYFNKSLEINPENYKAIYNRAVANLNDKNYPVRDALKDLDKVISLNPDTEISLGLLLIGCLSICDWEKFEIYKKIVEEKIKTKKFISSPLQLMSVFNSPEILYENAVSYVNKHCPAVVNVGLMPYNHKKIKIGYFSGDYRSHPVSYLICELLTLHNRSEFEVFAFSFLKEQKDEYTDLVSKSVDAFYDVNGKSNEEIIALVKSLEIDIAVDLGIFTGNQLSVFRERLAPVQVNFLGYCGTSGSSYIDYIIADNHTIPNDQEKWFSEKIIRLPVFMPRDTRIIPSSKVFTRLEAGLPERGFIFGSLSGYGKILPEVFKAWLTILKQVPESVLVLAENKDEVATTFLRSAALKEGIDPRRLIFFKKLDSFAEYLSRLKLVDLFLDTFPYGAHTNCNDAIWAGVPVLTIQGKTFGSRVASDFLINLKLNELIALDYVEYVDKAVRFGNNLELIFELKDRLNKSKKESPLFDMSYYTQKIEEAFKKTHFLSINKNLPQNITIDS
jgi:predicted O-linked N-acetylglucosamine transferase (SPINDLY family)